MLFKMFLVNSVVCGFPCDYALAFSVNYQNKDCENSKSRK